MTIDSLLLKLASSSNGQSLISKLAFSSLPAGALIFRAAVDRGLLFNVHCTP
jgi:hypothetical protein